MPSRIDLVFAVITALTASWYHALSRAHSFAFDDWIIATRPGRFGDLLQPHNQHLSLIPILVYRGLFAIDGLGNYVPFRLFGLLTLLGLVVAVYVYARGRIGDGPALLAAMVVLWAPSMPRVPFLGVWYLTLTFAVAVAAALPSRRARADAVVGLGVAAALLTASVGVPLAGVALVHSLLAGPRLRRLAAAGVPLVAWAAWKVSFGSSDTKVESLADLAEVGWHTFLGGYAGLVGGSIRVGAVLAAGCLALLVVRWKRDRASFATQVAWTAGAAAWSIGIAASRPVEAMVAPGETRYRFINLVFILLALLPAQRRTGRPLPAPIGPVPGSVVTAACLLLVVVIPVVNRPGIVDAAGPRDRTALEVRRAVIEVDQRKVPVLYDAVLPQSMGRATVGRYRETVERLGRLPIPPAPTTDLALLEAGAIRVRTPSEAIEPTTCAEVLVVPTGQQFRVRPVDGPVLVQVRRFQPGFVPLATVHTTQTFEAMTAVAPVAWVVTAPDGCLDLVPPG